MPIDNKSLAKMRALIGGGSASEVEVPDYLAMRLNRTLTEYSSDEVTQVGESGLSWCPALTKVSLPAATNVSAKGFQGCVKLSEVDLPLVTSVGTYAFGNNFKLPKIKLPVLTAVSAYTFISCIKLSEVDLPAVTKVEDNAFLSCSVLSALVLRSETMATLSGTNAFGSTPIANGTGYIYVPAALVEDYRNATNWSTYAAQIRPLENYTVDGTITGDLDASKITA